MSWKVGATGATLRRRGRVAPGAQAEATEACKGRRLRRSFVAECNERIACPVYDRYALAVGTRMTGPALVEERESTCVIDPKTHSR
ncbi:MAG: hypothetical protein R3E68_01400 [Burkholderiaceae bacterium]